MISSIISHLLLLLTCSYISPSLAISSLAERKGIFRSSSSAADQKPILVSSISGTFAVFSRSVGGPPHSNTSPNLLHFDLASGKLISNISVPQLDLDSNTWLLATFVSAENSAYGKPIFYVDFNYIRLITLDATSGEILNSVTLNPSPLLFSNGFTWAPKSHKLIGLATFKVMG